MSHALWVAFTSRTPGPRQLTLASYQSIPQKQNQCRVSSQFSPQPHLTCSLYQRPSTQWWRAHFLRVTRCDMSVSQSWLSSPKLVNKVKMPLRQSSLITTTSKRSLTLKHQWPVAHISTNPLEAMLSLIQQHLVFQKTLVTRILKVAKSPSKVAS